MAEVDAGGEAVGSEFIRGRAEFFGLSVGSDELFGRPFEEILDRDIYPGLFGAGRECAVEAEIVFLLRFKIGESDTVDDNLLCAENRRRLNRARQTDKVFGAFAGLFAKSR